MWMFVQLFMLFLIHAYGAQSWSSKTTSADAATASQGLLLMDAPWRLQWPCLVPWICVQAVVTVIWVRNAVKRECLSPCAPVALLSSKLANLMSLACLPVGFAAVQGT